METFRWLAALVLAAFFAGIAAYNWRYFLRHTRQGDERLTPVPVVGGLLGAFTLFVCPLAGAWEFWWAPFFIDFGSIPFLLWLAYDAATRRV